MENTITYNSELEDITLKEYGRNIQMIAKHITELEDEEQRTTMAHTLVELMKQINPGVKENNDYYNRIWNHLYLITDFQLDIKDSPFPKPERSSMFTKPETVPYSENRIKIRHYGKNIELLLNQAIAIENPEEKEDVIIYLGKVMKRFYQSWNKENVDDEIIIREIEKLSQGQLKIDLEKVKAGNLFYSAQPQNPGNNHSHGRDNNNNNNNHRKKKKKGGRR
jgi:hypothetical protein